jgi:malate dehydrogenase (oxaloacetate-decarboxylating)(NADP+)
LAYSPGVAVPCMEIHEKPETVYDYTGKGNLVAVISNGTAVLDWEILVQKLQNL